MNLTDGCILDMNSIVDSCTIPNMCDIVGFDVDGNPLNPQSAATPYESFPGFKRNVVRTHEGVYSRTRLACHSHMTHALFPTLTLIHVLTHALTHTHTHSLTHSLLHYCSPRRLRSPVRNYS